MSSLSLGLAVGAGTTPAGWARTLRLVERADRLGLHSVWLPEHHFHPNATPSPLITLAAFAARTKRVRLATTSLLLPVQHPLHVAAQVALLDQLSGGRVLLGLGRGFRPPLFRAFGVAAKTKRDRFDEALDTMLAAWTGTAFEQGGQYYGAGAVHLGLRPAQQPHPPLVVAAFGPKGLAQAARRGLPYLASPLEGLPVLAENYAFWREHCDADPDPRAPRVPVMRTAFVAEDDGTAARVRAALEGEQRIVPSRRPNKALARAAEGPLGDRVLVGTRSHVEDQIRGYRQQLGLDLLVVRTEVPGASENEREASLETLAELLA
ncbi:MAG: LLM class flavin-dependent oxidoreductase [bacterium]|nr:LLM class flavin-dependent oxidoreductase [bacterium]